MSWKQTIEKKLNNQKNKAVSINIETKKINYHEKIKSNIKTISGDEEISNGVVT